jgi:hypothetical protein
VGPPKEVDVDRDTNHVVARLCTAAGIIIEDAVPASISTPLFDRR